MIERVHVGLRTGFPHDRSCAADMIRMAVSENEVLEFLWRTAKPADRLKDGGLLAREPGVDECQSVVSFDQKGVRHPHRDDMHAVDHKLRAHGWTSLHRLRCKRTRLLFCFWHKADIPRLSSDVRFRG